VTFLPMTPFESDSFGYASQHIAQALAIALQQLGTHWTVGWQTVTLKPQSTPLFVSCGDTSKARTTGGGIRPTTHVNWTMRSLLRPLALWNLIGCLLAHTDTPDGLEARLTWDSPTERCTGSRGRAHVYHAYLGARPAHTHAPVDRQAEPAAGNSAEGSGAAPGQTF
jgi:hypothetical protein